ncbi:hypothetical protein [Pseudidiomarina atlantica]|uniref:hypothetical protein n=1 Tax=Pseudidiomarina atlantica TaxID=1517416 RepID=UPI000A5023A6|nr:hypothetical protein [Pseudidiomarina atlantica]
MKHLPKQGCYFNRMGNLPLCANSLKQGRLTGVGRIRSIGFPFRIIDLNPQRLGLK